VLVVDSPGAMQHLEEILVCVILRDHFTKGDMKGNISKENKEYFHMCVWGDQIMFLEMADHRDMKLCTMLHYH
jgi:hypothetical protein